MPVEEAGKLAGGETGTGPPFYLPSLDVLRFGAFLLVFLTHTISVDKHLPVWIRVGSWATGFGVPLFFVLSAYLITELLTREKRGFGSVAIRSFYLRRVLRIWPLYFVVLGVGFTACQLLHWPGFPVQALVAYSALAGNWYTGTHDYLPGGLGPLWSISVEEQFYLVWPFLVRTLDRTWLLGFCGLGWCVSQLVIAFLCLHHAAIDSIWTNTLVHLQYFAIGAAVSLWLDGRSIRLGAKTTGAVFAAATLLLLSVGFLLQLDPRHPFVGTSLPAYLLAGAATALFLVGCLGFDTLGRLSFLRYLGKISYGLYVFHLSCLLLAQSIARAVPVLNHERLILPGAMVLTIASAAFSYQFFERPFLRLKARFERIASRPA